MTDVNEIHFHTHALTSPAISDAAFLALSPEPRGDEYALTAEAVSKLKLQAHPLVVLAACSSAQGAHYEHAPLSLPAAFIFAGARAVFATGRSPRRRRPAVRPRPGTRPSRCRPRRGTSRSTDREHARATVGGGCDSVRLRRRVLER